MVVALELAVGQVPDLDELVPAGGDDDGVLGKWGESDTGDPLGVALLLDGVLADSQSVPQLDGAVTGGGDDLAVVGGKGDGENVLGVANEAAGGVARGQVPQTEGAVPGTGETELAIGGDDDVTDEVRVTVQSAFWDAILAKSGVLEHVSRQEIALDRSNLPFLTGQLPHDDGLVTGGREEHVWEDGGGGDLGDPAVVATECTLASHLLARHFGFIRVST